MKKLFIILIIIISIIGCADTGVYTPTSDGTASPGDDTVSDNDTRIIDLDELHIDTASIKAFYHITDSDGMSFYKVLRTGGSTGSIEILDSSNNTFPDEIVRVSDWQQIGFEQILIIAQINVMPEDPIAPTALTDKYKDSNPMGTFHFILDIASGELSVFHPSMWGRNFQILRNNIIWDGNVTTDLASTDDYLIVTDMTDNRFTRLTNPNLYYIQEFLGVTPTNEAIILSGTMPLEAYLVPLNGAPIIDVSSSIETNTYFYSPDGNLFMADFSRNPPNPIYRVERSGSDLSYTQVETDSYDFYSAFLRYGSSNRRWINSPSIRIDDSQVAFLNFVDNVPTVSVEAFNSTSPISGATSFSRENVIWHKNSSEIYTQVFGSAAPASLVMDNLTGLLTEYYARDLMFYSKTVGIDTYTYLLDTTNSSESLLFENDFDETGVEVFFIGN